MKQAVRFRDRRAGDFAWVFPHSNAPSPSYTTELPSQSGPFPTPSEFVTRLELLFPAVGKSVQSVRSVLEVGDQTPILAQYVDWVGIPRYSAFLTSSVTTCRWAGRFPHFEFLVGELPAYFRQYGTKPKEPPPFDCIVWTAEQRSLEDFCRQQNDFIPLLPLERDGILLLCHPRANADTWVKLQSLCTQQRLSVTDCFQGDGNWDWLVARRN